MNLINIFFIPPFVPFGADTKEILFTKSTVIKKFRTNDSYNKTLYFYKEYIKSPHDQYFFPKLIEKYDYENEITFEYCGKLLNLWNLPNDWQRQLNNLHFFFKKKQMLVLDIRFMIHTPYVINNLCIKDNRIYLVDLGFYKKRNNEYIDLTFNRLINKIYFFNKWKKYPIVLFLLHFIYLIIWLITDFFEKIYFTIKN